jgi:hypothetical protein
MPARLVIIESPLRGRVPSWAPRWLAPLFERVDRWRNKRYARACMRDSLMFGEAPYASHLIYDQPGVLDDAEPAQRKIGMDAGFAWGSRGDLCAVYVDLGITDGMRRGMELALQRGLPIEERSLSAYRPIPWHRDGCTRRMSLTPARYRRERRERLEVAR